MYVLIIFGILCSIGFLNLFYEKRISRHVIVGVAVGVLVFFAVRFHLGSDLSNYYYAFNRVSSPIGDAMKYNLQRNLGFNVFLYYSKQLLKTFPMFIFLVNLVCLGQIGWVIFQKSRQYLLSIAILIGGGVLEVYISSGLRQAIAMALFFFAFYTFLPKKKVLPYYLFCILAFLFHEAGLVTLLVPILLFAEPYIRNHKEKVFVITVLLVAGMQLLCFRIIPENADYIERLFPYISVRHLLNYFSVRPAVSLLGISMELCFLGLVLYLWYFSEIDKANDFEFLQLLTIFFSVVLYMGFSGIPIISRVSDLLQVIFIIVLPNWMSQIKNKKWKVLSLAGVIAIHGVLLWVDLREKCPHITLPDDSVCTIETYPYLTVFDPQVNSYLEKQ